MWNFWELQGCFCAVGKIEVWSFADFKRVKCPNIEQFEDLQILDVWNSGIVDIIRFQIYGKAIVYNFTVKIHAIQLIII